VGRVSKDGNGAMRRNARSVGGWQDPRGRATGRQD
jgi:hypothetical protein